MLRRVITVLLLLVHTLAWGQDMLMVTNGTENIGLGQFNVRTLSLQNILRPGQSSHSSYYINKGDARITFGLGYGNIWNYYKDHYVVDGEWGQADLRFAYAVTDKLELGLLLPFSMRNGGFLDNSIEKFHSAFGIENQEREEFPQDQVRVEFYEDGTAFFSLTESSSGINDVPLFLVWHISKGNESRPAVVVQPSITLPVGDEKQLEGTGEPAYGLSIIVAKRIGRSSHNFYLEGNVSYSHQNKSDDLLLRDEVFGGALTWEYRWSARTSLIAQYNVANGIADDFRELSNPAHHINLGMKRKLSQNMIFEFSIQENLFYHNNSVDAAVNTALTTLF